MERTVVPQDSPTQYTVPQLAAITEESEAVWRKRILYREIAYVKCGSNVRVSQTELQRWLRARTILALESGAA